MPRMSEPYVPIDHAVVFDLAMTLAKHLTKVSKTNAQAACVCASVMCSLDAERFGPEGELLDLLSWLYGLWTQHSLVNSPIEDTFQ